MKKIVENSFVAFAMNLQKQKKNEEMKRKSFDCDKMIISSMNHKKMFEKKRKLFQSAAMHTIDSMV